VLFYRQAVLFPDFLMRREYHETKTETKTKKSCKTKTRNHETETGLVYSNYFKMRYTDIIVITVIYV